MKKETKSWNDISIEMYYKIKDVCEDNTIEPIERDIRLLSIIYDEPEEKYWNMSVTDMSAEISKLDFLNKFELIKVKPDKINIYGKDYTIIYDTRKINVAQYIDWQTFVKMPFRDSIDKLLSVFVIPKNYKYNEGYDIADVQKQFREKMPFLLAQSILNFILAKYLKSVKSSLTYLARKSRKNPKIREQMYQMMSQIQDKMNLMLER